MKPPDPPDPSDQIRYAESEGYASDAESETESAYTNDAISAINTDDDDYDYDLPLD